MSPGDDTGVPDPDAVLGAARRTAGFLPDDEGLVLARLAEETARAGLGPILEVGAYCGRSSLYLAAGLARARRAGAGVTAVFSVDHHRGSEELQAGWEHHDPSLVDPRSGRMDTLPRWRRAVEEAGAEGLVVAVVGESSLVASTWPGRLGLVFVDGGHAPDVVRADYLGWARLVAPGGTLAFHDVYLDPAEGGQGPRACYEAALASGLFSEREDGEVGSLRALRALGGLERGPLSRPSPPR